jgi:hypothetical protein
MKTNRLIIAGLLALSSAVIGNAAPVTAAVGDLILGFSASTGSTGAATNLEVDLGNVGSFFQADQGGTLVAGQVVDLSSKLALTDLSSTYGTWQSNAGLTWGVAAASAKSPSSTIVDGTAYKSTIWAATQKSSPLTVLGLASAQAAPVGNINGIATGTGGLNGATAAGTSVSALMAASGGASWSTLAVTGGNTYNGLPLTTLIGTNATVSQLDLYQLVPNTSGTPGKLLGTFSLFGDGSTQYLTFTSVSAIPEPSTYAMILGVAALGFVMLRRRQQSLA